MCVGRQKELGAPGFLFTALDDLFLFHDAQGTKI